MYRSDIIQVFSPNLHDYISYSSMISCTLSSRPDQLAFLGEKYV